MDYSSDHPEMFPMKAKKEEHRDSIVHENLSVTRDTEIIDDVTTDGNNNNGTNESCTGAFVLISIFVKKIFLPCLVF